MPHRRTIVGTRRFRVCCIQAAAVIVPYLFDRRYLACYQAIKSVLMIAAIARIAPI